MSIESHLLPSFLSDLPRESLLSILETVAGEPVATFSATVENAVGGYVGYCSDTLIPTFTYTTHAGRTGREVVFVKRMKWDEPTEVNHYEYLLSRDVPVAQLYGAMRDEEGREVLFLEYLPRIGVNMTIAEEVRRRIVSLARFNATAITKEYLPHLPYDDPKTYIGSARGEKEEAILDLLRVLDHAERGELGEAIAKLGGHLRRRLPDLARLARSLRERIGKMEVGLLHNDYAPQNVGWRDDGTLAIFDLHKTGRGPRFADAARILGGTATADTIDVSEVSEEATSHGLSRDEMAQLYLSEWTRRYEEEEGRQETVITLDGFREEVEALWSASLFSLGWQLDRALDGCVDWTNDCDEGRRVYRSWLYRKLDALLRTCANARSS